LKRELHFEFDVQEFVSTSYECIFIMKKT
jgi:hypothetical protein